MVPSWGTIAASPRFSPRRHPDIGDGPTIALRASCRTPTLPSSRTLSGTISRRCAAGWRPPCPGIGGIRAHIFGVTPLSSGNVPSDTASSPTLLMSRPAGSARKSCGVAPSNRDDRRHSSLPPSREIATRLRPSRRSSRGRSNCPRNTRRGRSRSRARVPRPDRRGSLSDPVLFTALERSPCAEKSTA